jgi:hypothetical protein
VSAGQYLGIGLDLGRISQEQMTALKTKLEATKSKLVAQDFASISKDDILGDLLYVTAMSYHAELGVTKYVSAKTMGVMAITLPSETIFSSELKSNYLFGIPLSVSSGGLSMDADRLCSLVKALDGSKDKPAQFMLSAGMASSASEHRVPEQLFSTPDNPAQGISAVKALQLANDQGIPVYTINQSNIASILPQLHLDSGTIEDIQSAVNAGKIVTASKTDISFNGWTGCGYIIVDPFTGDGAYMISGGMNGGLIMVQWAWIFLFMAYLNLAACVMGMIVMCAVAAAFAIIAVAYMNVGMCMLNSINYQPAGNANQVLFGTSQLLFYALANSVGVMAAKRVPGGSTMQSVFWIRFTATITDIIAAALNITCGHP